MSTFVMKRMARVVPNQQGDYGHRFGGPSMHQGAIPRGSKKPLHLLYVFDTKDPLFPIRGPVVRYLPLYYCFSYNAGKIGYRVVSKEAIEILYMSDKRPSSDSPYPNYPDEFPETPVLLSPITYEEHKTLAYYVTCRKAGIFIFDSLSATDQRLLKQMGYPFTQLGGIQLMWQDAPDSRCPNKKCENHKYDGSLQVFAVVWNKPVPGVFLWSEENTEMEIIFEICPKCKAIEACPSCT